MDPADALLRGSRAAGQGRRSGAPGPRGSCAGRGRPSNGGRNGPEFEIERRREAMTRKQRRLTLIAVAGFVLALALGLVLYAMSDTIVFFNAPSDIQTKNVQPGTRFRLGGLVKEGSV